MSISNARLPRSLIPHQEESLRGYLLNLSHRMDVPPHLLLRRLGLAASNNDVVQKQLALVLEPARSARFAECAGLAPEQVLDLTYMRYAGRLFDEAFLKRDPLSLYGGLWIPKSAPDLYCPKCLTSYEDEHGIERVLWKTRWLSPWSFACVQHDTMLVSGCINQSQHLLHSRRLGLFALARREVHPGYCRENTDGGRKRASDNPLCLTPLTDTPRIPLTGLLRETQQRLDSIIDGSSGPLMSHDEPVGPIDYLLDLRTLAVIFSIDGGETHPLAQVGDDLVLSATRFAEQRRDLLIHAERLNNKDFVWSRPIDNLEVASTVYATGLQLLDEPDAGSIVRELGNMLRAVKPSMWFRVRMNARQSGQLSTALRVQKNALLSDDTIRLARAGLRLRCTADHVPAVVPEGHLQLFFDGYDPRLRFSIERLAPIIAMKMLGQESTETAVGILGYQMHHLGAVTSLNDVLTTGEERQAFLNKTRVWLEHLDEYPVHYGHRRRYFADDWLLPEVDWKRLKRILLRSGRVRRDTVDRRHRHYSVWVWSLVTSGYAGQAPMIEPFNDRLNDPDHGAMGFLSKVKRSRSAQEHVSLVEAFAANLAAVIDQTAPPPTI